MIKAEPGQIRLFLGSVTDGFAYIILRIQGNSAEFYTLDGSNRKKWWQIDDIEKDRLL